MKLTIKVIALCAALTAASQATLTIGGLTGTNFQNNSGNKIPSGSMYMLIADTTGNGFLNQSTQGAITSSLTGQSGNTISIAQAGNFSLGSVFGGDTVVSIGTASAAGVVGSLLSGVSIASYVSDKFAVVWFADTQANVTANPGGEYFGMIRLANWVFPAADSGTYTLAAGTQGSSNFYAVSNPATATQVGAGVGFFTGSGTAANTGSTAVTSAQFQIVGVPEPSAAILGAFGLLGLLRRRR